MSTVDFHFAKGFFFLAITADEQAIMTTNAITRTRKHFLFIVDPFKKLCGCGRTRQTTHRAPKSDGTAKDYAPAIPRFNLLRPTLK
jgi:hypothetical protein